jgi:hypothetical protein
MCFAADYFCLDFFETNANKSDAMKKILSYFSLLLFPAAANAQEPIAAAKLQLLRLMQTNKQLEIFKAFPKEGTVYFYPGNPNPPLQDLLFDFLKEDERFRLSADQPKKISGIAPIASVSLTDSIMLHATEGDIRVAIDGIMQDPIFTYVLLRFRSEGSLSLFYRGFLFCKFDASGNLLKYSLLEK